MHTLGIVVSIFFITSLSLGEYTPDYGTCTINCYTEVVTSTGGACGELDFSCLCVNLAFSTAWAQCVGSMCGSTELASTASMASQACEDNYGEAPVLSTQQFIDVGSAAASSQAASTGTTPAVENA